jgi:signal transduction histidine kinase
LSPFSYDGAFQLNDLRKMSTNGGWKSPPGTPGFTRMISIRRRLTVILTLHLIAAILAAGLLVWIWARRSIQSQFDATLMARAELIQSTIEEDDGHLEIEFNLTRLPEFRSEHDPVHFQIRTRDGQPVITSEKFASLHLPDLQWGRGSVPAWQSFETLDGTGFRSLETKFDAVDDASGDFQGLRLLIVRDRRELDASLLQLAGIVAGSAAASLAFLIPLVRRALRQGLKPLEAFAARTGEIDLRRLPHRESLEGAPAELHPMVEKLNELLERVHESLLRERRFTRDVAHELRTPVAELKTLAELVSRWSDEATPRAFSDVGEIAAEMETLVTGLTLLNRLDAGSVTRELSGIAPAAILRQIAARLAERITKKGLTLSLPPEDDATTWETDPVLWKIAASNLLENAVAYSPPGSHIEVEVTDGRLSVTNPAPELAPADILQMTHPFWRKDAARTDQTHSGLGLELVDSIARVLQLHLHLSLSDDGKLTVSLSQEFPR